MTHYSMWIGINIEEPSVERRELYLTFIYCTPAFICQKLSIT